MNKTYKKLEECASKTHRTYEQQTEFHKRLNNILQIKPNYSSYSSGTLSWSQTELKRSSVIFINYDNKVMRASSSSSFTFHSCKRNNF